MDVYVSLSSLETDEPVYHLPTDDDPDLHRTMKCNDRLHEFESVRMPLRHAEKFARPCENCFS